MSNDKHYLVTVHDAGNITDDPRNIHTILTSRDNIQPPERVEVVEHDAGERTFDAKVCQYVADPGFDGTVRQYLATMCEEYEQQVRHPTDIGHPAYYAGRLAAYRDALRVLDDAIDAAARFGS
jgi:hypothetical protein